MIRAVNWYCRKSFSVVPVSPSTKKALVKWKQFQTRRATEKEVNEWWTRWPDALCALICGEVSGITVVDADTDEGVALIESLIPDSLELPMASTPSGFRHYYFEYTPGLKNWVRPLPGLDVRTDGGFVLAPPSQKASGKYSWFDGLGIHQVKPAPMPDALRLALIDGGKREKPTSTIADSKRVTVGRYGAAALARELAILVAAPKGQRNAQLNRSAHALGQLVASGELDQTQVEIAIESVARSIGLNHEEIKNTIASGMETGMRKPRKADKLNAKDRNPHHVKPKKKYARISIERIA